MSDHGVDLLGLLADSGIVPDKQTVHAVLQAHGQFSQPGLDGAVLVKWLSLGEFAVPDGRMALHRFSGDVGGRGLYTWEANGLLFDALFRHGTPRTNGV